MSRPSCGKHLVQLSSWLLYCSLRAEVTWWIFVSVYSSPQSSNFSNVVQCTGTCLVTSCLWLSHGKFEDTFGDFFAAFRKTIRCLSFCCFCFYFLYSHTSLPRTAITHLYKAPDVKVLPFRASFKFIWNFSPLSIRALYLSFTCLLLRVICKYSIANSSDATSHVFRSRDITDRRLGGWGDITYNCQIISANTCWHRTVG